MKEIEYKFLINMLPKQIFYKKIQKIEIKQYYFQKNKMIIYLKKLNLSNKQIDQIESVRVRVENFDDKNKYMINAQSFGGFVRDEYEIQITKKQYENILKKETIGKVIKTRYRIKYKNFVFEFDKYHDNLEGLYTCEIEVKNTEENYFEITRALNAHFKLNIKDITNNQKYKNMNLSKEIIYENNW